MPSLLPFRRSSEVTSKTSCTRVINSVKAGGLGLSPKEVQERLGHSSILITMNTYSHPFERLDDGSEMSAAAPALLGEGLSMNETPTGFYSWTDYWIFPRGVRDNRYFRDEHGQRFLLAVEQPRYKREQVINPGAMLWRAQKGL